MGCRCRKNDETRISYRILEGWHLEDLEECENVVLILFAQGRQWFVSREIHADIIKLDRFFCKRFGCSLSVSFHPCSMDAM
jgi:hypothetical protein